VRSPVVWFITARQTPTMATRWIGTQTADRHLFAKIGQAGTDLSPAFAKGFEALQNGG
jgi:hypothetical protein